MTCRAVWQGALALVAYVAAAVAASWPLPRHLSTHLTGTPGSDAGVYLWNTWVFRHEVVDQPGGGRLPAAGVVRERAGAVGIPGIAGPGTGDSPPA